MLDKKIYVRYITLIIVHTIYSFTNAGCWKCSFCWWINTHSHVIYRSEKIRVLHRKYSTFIPHLVRNPLNTEPLIWSPARMPRGILQKTKLVGYCVFYPMGIGSCYNLHKNRSTVFIIISATRHFISLVQLLAEFDNLVMLFILQLTHTVSNVHQSYNK